MKKIYSLLTMMLVGLAFGQTPMITAIMDGDCPGGNPKVLEIYANGTVDFTQYSLENQTNANTEWGNPQSLADFGTVTNDFVYVYSDSSDPEVLATEFPDATMTLESSTMNLNGDDRVRIVNASSTVIDVYGVDGTDGTDQVWEYTDGFAKRIDGTPASATFNAADWTYGMGAFDGMGACQGADIFQTVMGGIGTFTTEGSEEPMLSILSPANNSTLPLGTTDVDIEFSVMNFTIGNPGDSGVDGHIHYTVDGGGVVMYYSADPIHLEGLSIGEHTVMLTLVDNSHTPISPEVSASVTFTIPEANNVANIGELRAGMTDGTIYTLTGQALVTFTQTYRNQKYIQDSTGGILIDDAADVLAMDYVAGDRISGITGTLSLFNGVVQFTPVQAGSAPVSSGNAVNYQVITIADFMANPTNYESELIAFADVSFADAGGTFATATNYEVSQGSDVTQLRTAFFDIDEIGTTIPATANIVTIGARFNDTPQLSLVDIVDQLGVSDAMTADVNMTTVWNAQATFTVDGKASVEIYNLNGQLVQKANGNNTFNVNVSGLAKGVYVVKVTVDGKTAVQKAVKK
jgi:hypothetical protein